MLIEEHPLDADEGRRERGEVREVAPTHIGTARRQILELFRIAGHRDDVAGPAFEQQVDDAAAELAAGAGDKEGGFVGLGHEESSRIGPARKDGRAWRRSDGLVDRTVVGYE